MPILYIGQQSVLAADAYIHLSGLSLTESHVLIKEYGLSLANPKIERLHQLTNGNPRLLKLCAPVLSAGEVNVHQLSQEASITALFSTLWQTLSSAEQELAQQLSVFRSPSPIDAWQTRQKFELSRLHTLSLLQIDDEGGVWLVPIFVALIGNDPQKMSADTVEKCHMNAAAIRFERGEYSSAVYHLIQAGEPEQAIMLWFVQRKREIAKGLGGQIYALLQHIPKRRLSAEGQRALALSLAES